VDGQSVRGAGLGTAVLQEPPVYRGYLAFPDGQRLRGRSATLSKRVQLADHVHRQKSADKWSLSMYSYGIVK